ncbi:MAG: 30S ribosomal protein S9 [bacterium]|nr:30S ribosomal protein S9 [bacterium]
MSVAQKPSVGLKPKPEKYFEGLGRRKRATARVRLYTSNPQNSAEAGNIEVEGKPYKTYFPGERLFLIVEDPLKKLKSMNRFRATVRVAGGGTHAQAEAVRHGLSRALTLFDQNFRKRLKRAGFLKRDPREKERKKYGLKKARRRPQWAKR